MIAIDLVRAASPIGLSFGLALIVAGLLAAVILSRLGFTAEGSPMLATAALSVGCLLAGGAGACAVTGLDMREAREARVAQIAGGWGLAESDALLLERTTSTGAEVTLPDGSRGQCIIVTAGGRAELRDAPSGACLRD